MLLCDAACAALTVYLLISATVGFLTTWQVYVINFLMGSMDAVQTPAAHVTTSLITPPRHYTRIGGFTAFSGAARQMITPALATAPMAFSGLKAVLLFDLITFAYAAITLGFFVKIPPVVAAVAERFSWRQCLDGFKFLRARPQLNRFVMAFVYVNLLAAVAGNRLVSAMVLARTGGNEVMLGIVSTAIGVGTLLGSVAVTIAKSPEKRVRSIYAVCAVSFLLNLFYPLGRNAMTWVLGAVAANFVLPFLNANLMAELRERVPIGTQGRVFSTRSAMQNTAITVGYVLGGALADYAFEPFMSRDSLVATAIGRVLGNGPGTGMALMLLIGAIIGVLLNIFYFGMEKREERKA